MDLRTILENVDSKGDLASLIDRLREDFENYPETWENADLASFLEAMSAWLQDMNGYYQNLGEPIPTSPTWKTLGEILLASRTYE